VDETRGLRRIAAGSMVGLAAGIVGLALPIGLFLLATYSPGTVLLSGPTLIEAAALLALAGTLLFALSLSLYRIGFWALQSYDRGFWSASVLCLLGTIGAVLIAVPIALAFLSSDAISNCIKGAPTHALTCLGSAAPLAASWAIVAFWLVWFGGLGVVVGIILAGRRYSQGWFYGSATLYALLLLGFVGPILGLLFPIGALTYPLILTPILILIAPAATIHGCRIALKDR
jgi:hypothetical protein